MNLKVRSNILSRTTSLTIGWNYTHLTDIVLLFQWKIYNGTTFNIKFKLQIWKWPLRFKMWKMNKINLHKNVRYFLYTFIPIRVVNYLG